MTQNTNHKRFDATMSAYRRSLGLSHTDLARLLGVSPNRLADIEAAGIHPDEDTMDFLEDRRMALIEEIHSFMDTEQQMRKAGESDPETGGWTFELYRSPAEFEHADQPTHIRDWQTWNQAYYIIGLLMEAMGYQIDYTYPADSDGGRKLA